MHWLQQASGGDCPCFPVSRPTLIAVHLLNWMSCPHPNIPTTANDGFGVGEKNERDRDTERETMCAKIRGWKSQIQRR
jgi:hypothetical protein